MPYTDPVFSLASGRNSRASNVSGATGASRSVRSPPPSMPPNDTLVSAGVLSMLKTSTDTGDIGALSFNTSRLPSMPRATHQRRGHAPRPSQHHTSGVSSNHSYAPSQNSRISSQWDNASTQRRGSLTSMQSMPPSLPPVHVGKQPLTMMPPAPDNPRDSRSYSMTSAPAQQLPRHRSATSLKSQGHEPRKGNRMPPGPVPPMPENRPPFVYPTRLKRPGYRSPSPALSDTYAHGPLSGAPHMPRRAPGQGPHLPPPQAYAGYNVDYQSGYPQDPNLLNVRPPPHNVNNSPGQGYAPNPYPYRQGPMRPMPPPGMPHGMAQPMMSPHQHPMQPPPPAHYQARGVYPGPQYAPPRPGYGPYSQIAHAGPRGPPMPGVAPMAHQMFHNAARMARTLPQRTDTPMTDIPSSDPPSSGSAPDSSNPPTPKDHTTIQVVVDPAFINPDLVDLPDSSSEPVLPAKYFDYADGLERPIHEPDMEVPHPSVPPSGFVQRVKAMLESKAAAEAAAAARHDGEKGSRQDEVYELDVDHEQEDVSDLAELHELAANETPRFTIIEEFEAPVELPASPVKVAELDAVEASQRQSTQRLTRELIKAELGPSSVDNTMYQYLPDDTTTNLIVTMQRKQEGEMPELEEPAEESDQADAMSRPSQEHADIQRKDSVTDTATTASGQGSIPSGVGYAIRFSGQIDSTVASDETQSKDPFALDADTITMQQQSRDASGAESKHEIKTSKTPEPPRDLRYENEMGRTPVSPLRSDEMLMHRTSAVSPLHTETLGIDETLRLAAEDRTEITGIDEVSEPESSQQGDSMPPPTPRTPKTYSKSVQIQPSVTTTDSTSTGTNRFSLPGDLSTVGDTTINSASEMVTDVAVRFSLPQTTVTVGKPQIVDVSTSSTPDRPKIELTSFQKQHAGLKSSRRGSVTFADEIAPLNITKKAESHRQPQASSEASANKSKSIIRKPAPPREDTIDSLKSFRDSTADFRFSNPNNGNVGGNRFGSTHLPGLKEESVEDMSISEQKRYSAENQFPLPARIAAVKAMQERRLQESVDKVKSRRQARQHNRPLADTRDLPSLNFSRIDLIDRLNEALEIRPAKSMDIVRRRDYSGIYCPSPQRPQSTEPLRERYMSFFSKPDEFSSFIIDESGHSDDDMEPEPETEKALVPALQIQETTEIEGVEPAKRPLSPEDFLDFASQVQRLSVPTVTPLTDRLSELIPGLRNLSNLQLDDLFGSAHDGMDLGQHGALGRPDTVMTSRTSAGFRTLAERAEEIVKNGTHDSMAQLARSLGLNKELPPLPESASANMVSSALSSPDGKPSYLSGSTSAPSDLGKDPTQPMSALLRTKAPTNEEEVAQMLPKEMNPITRQGKRSMVLSQPSSRPWNLDKSYPWAEKEIEIDLMVPCQAHTRNSFASEVLRVRRTKSLDLTAPIEASETTNGIDIGSITTSHLPSSASITTEQLTGITPKHIRKLSKRSIIGSISKKFGLSGRCTAADEDTTTKSLPKSPLPRRASTHQSHKPGDRYPTSGLTPPAGFNLDEVRSFFSDNSSERDRTASFRKRLTGFKGKSKAVRVDQSRGQSFDGNTAYDAGSMAEARLGADSRAHTYDGVGMSKTEFHIKRFGEKLRNLFARGGELIRSLSTRSTTKKRLEGRAQHNEWLADSLLDSGA